jgi:hypothetical protein
LSAALFDNSWSSVPLQTVTLQPGPGSNDGTDDGSDNKGKDAGFTLSPSWYLNDGSGAYIWLFNSSCNIGLYPGFLQFSLNGMPKQNISKAEIQVYTLVYFNGSGWPWSIDPIISLSRLTQAWDEMAVIPSNQPTLDSTVLDSHTIDTLGGSGTPYIEFQDWLSFDITDLYKGWADGSIPNNGVAFQVNPYCVNGNIFSLYTSDNTDPTLRPKLVVTAECASPPSGMVSWWSGDGHAFDLVDDNDGTLMGNATYAEGIVGKAFNFDGVDDYVAVSLTTGFPSGTSARTIDAWFKTSAEAEQEIIHYGVADTNKSTYIGIDDTSDCAAASGTPYAGYKVLVGTWGGGSNLCGTTKVNDGLWHHVAATYDGSTTWKIYVDGILQSQTTAIPTNTENDLSMAIGRVKPGSLTPINYAFNGLIDELEVFSRALSQTEIQAIYNAGAAGKCKPCFEPPSDMVSWWPFDDGTGSVAYDSISSNDGTVYGATWSAGNVEGALSFDGVDDYVSVPDSPSVDFSPTSPITIDLWAYRTASDSTMHLIAKRDYCGSINFQIAFDQNTGLHFVGNSGGVVTNADLPLNTWTHLAGTFDGANTFKFYINGLLAGTGSGTLGPVNDFHLTIGKAGSCGYLFKGIIDEVEIFNRALSAEEIAAIYAAGSAGKCKTQSEPDVDQDGVPDATDNCVNIPNATQEDSDSDSIGDACDNCPYVSNPDQQDTNHNGIGDICENRPDLSGNWTRLLVSNQSKALLGYIRVSNTGNRNASNFYVSFYISNDGQSLDTLLKKIPVYGLAAGRSKDLSLSQVSRTSLSGKYLIAVIDSGNQVAESNEANNRTVRLIP